jgi:hypothetical protein
LLVGSVAAGCFVAACADIFGIHNAAVDSGAADGGGDVIIDVPYDYVVFDAVDFDVNTAVCGDGGVPFVDAGDAVWVSADGGLDNAQCGVAASPCKSIAQALANRAGRTVIYLDGTEFDEVVTLGSTQTGITVQGGWVRVDGGWQAQCDNTHSIIQGPEEAGPAAVEVNTSGVTLRLVTVKSKIQGAQGQTLPVPETVYAVRATDSPNLFLDNVTLIAQNAGGGSPGSTPLTPPGCTTTGGNGSSGTMGGAGQGGTFSASGFAPATAASGSPGQPGNYTPPTAGSCNPNCNVGCP